MSLLPRIHPRALALSVSIIVPACFSEPGLVTDEPASTGDASADTVENGTTSDPDESAGSAESAESDVGTNTTDVDAGTTVVQRDGSSTDTGSTTGDNSETASAGSEASETGSEVPYYGDPAFGCRVDEEPVFIDGVRGEICAASCDTHADCPALAPAGEGLPQCSLGLNGSPVPTHCIIACLTAEPGQCPRRATCKEVALGAGVCTYP